MVALRHLEEVDSIVGVSFDSVLTNIKKLHDAGVRIYTGIELDQISDMSILVRDSSYKELELLAYVGLSDIDVLRAAGVIPIMVLSLEDRAVVSSGRRGA